LDVFKSDAFNVLSLTTAINKLPFKPSRLKQLGIFKVEGVTTTQIAVEEQNGKLMLIPQVARGSSPNVMGGKKRNIRSLMIPHLPLVASVMADDVQNVRSFGSDSEVQTVAEIVNDKLGDMKQNMEYTHEYHRIGAMKGILLDANGGTIYNFFTEFDITQATAQIDWAVTQTVKKTFMGIRRTIEDNLGMTPYDSIHIMMGKTLFDNIITSAEVRTAYERWQMGQMLRDSQVRSEFEYAGVTIEEYRGKVGATPFIADTEGYAFPIGAPDVFKEVYAPANFIETVNTKGKPIYAKQEEQRFGLGVDIMVQSNPLIMCTRPSALVKLTQTGTPV
jgi:hypothetical protein